MLSLLDGITRLRRFEERKEIGGRASSDRPAVQLENKLNSFDAEYGR